jgi:hypothetical protein
LNTALQPPDKPSVGTTGTGTVQPFAPLYDFVKNHVLIVNALIAFATFSVGLLDFFFSHRPEVGHFIYTATAVLAVMLLLAALWPDFGRRFEVLIFGQQTEGARRGVFQFCASLFVLVSVFGNISMAKAAQGGVLASQFPELQAIQDRLLGLETKLTATNQKIDTVHASVLEVKEKVSQSTDEIKKTGNEIKEKLDVIASRPPVVVAAERKSQNPRELLQQMGVSWSSESALDALKRCDGDAVELFVRGGFDFFDKSAGTPISGFATHCKLPEKSRRVLKILSGNGVDLRQRFQQIGYAYGTFFYQTDIMGVALLNDNHNLVSALIDMGIKPKLHYGIYMSFSETDSKTPLVVTILHQAYFRGSPPDPQAVPCEGHGMETLKVLIKKNVLTKDAVTADLSKYCVFPAS